jgi:hypothetical protein
MGEEAEATVSLLWSEDWLDDGMEHSDDPRGCYDDVHKGSAVRSAGCPCLAVRKESRVVYGWRVFLVEVWDGETPLCDHMEWRNAYMLEVAS